jgi:glycosyltransferase involved in cell wall biosynthesis
MKNDTEKIRVLINQRFLTRYREDVFYELSRDESISLLVTFGDRKSKKFSKFKSITMTPRFNYKRLFTISLIFERFGHINQIFFSPGIILQLLKFRPHVVLTEGTSNILNNLLLCSYCLLANTPYIWWDLGKIRGQQSESLFRRILYPIIKYFFSRAQTILAYSNYAKEHFIKEGIPAENICVAGNTIRLDKHLSYRELNTKAAAELKNKINFDKRFNFLTVGAIDKNKRFDVLISIFLKLQQKYKEIGLIIVGDGPDLDSLKQLAYGCSNIYFAGAQFEDIGLYYMMSDVFVLPGLGGLAINEAMAYALPIISVPADGTERDLILNRQTGILLENNSGKLIYSAMEWFINNKEKIVTMGKKAHAHIVNNFNFPTMIDIIKTVIHAAKNI